MDSVVMYCYKTEISSKTTLIEASSASSRPKHEKWVIDTAPCLLIQQRPLFLHISCCNIAGIAI